LELGSLIAGTCPDADAVLICGGRLIAALRRSSGVFAAFSNTTFDPSDGVERCDSGVTLLGKLSRDPPGARDEEGDGA
jgi:hypothetical protein